MVTLKKCFVPTCFNTTLNSKNKIFKLLPYNLERRAEWYKSVNNKSPTNRGRIYCCEDHFDFENDCENWQEYRMFGTRLRFKKNVVPHKYIDSPKPPDLSGESQLTNEDKKQKFENLKVLGESALEKFFTDPAIAHHDFSEFESSIKKSKPTSVTSLMTKCFVQDSPQIYSTPLLLLVEPTLYATPIVLENTQSTPPIIKTTSNVAPSIINVNSAKVPISRSQRRPILVRPPKTENLETKIYKKRINLAPYTEEELKEIKNKIRPFNNNTLECWLCLYRTESRSFLKRHLFDYHRVKYFFCLSCKYGTIWQFALEHHKARHKVVAKQKKNRFWCHDLFLDEDKSLLIGSEV